MLSAENWTVIGNIRQKLVRCEDRINTIIAAMQDKQPELQDIQLKLPTWTVEYAT